MYQSSKLTFLDFLGCSPTSPPLIQVMVGQRDSRKTYFWNDFAIDICHLQEQASEILTWNLTRGAMGLTSKQHHNPTTEATYHDAV